MDVMRTNHKGNIHLKKKKRNQKKEKQQVQTVKSESMPTEFDKYMAKKEKIQKKELFPEDTLMKIHGWTDEGYEIISIGTDSKNLKQANINVNVVKHLLNEIEKELKASFGLELDKELKEKLINYAFNTGLLGLYVKQVMKKIEVFVNEIKGLLKNEKKKSKKLKVEINKIFKKHLGGKTQKFINIMSKDKKLGRGSSGCVLNGTAKKIVDGKQKTIEIVIKVFNHNNMKKIKREYELLKRFQGNEHFLKLYGLGKVGKNIFIAMEKAGKGSLKDNIEFTSNPKVLAYLKSQGYSQSSLIRYIIKECLLGIQHMHKKGFIHSDIKPDNFFVTNDGDIKVGDFGMVDNKDFFPHSMVVNGTVIYLSPEECAKGMYRIRKFKKRIELQKTEKYFSRREKELKVKMEIINKGLKKIEKKREIKLTDEQKETAWILTKQKMKVKKEERVLKNFKKAMKNEQKLYEYATRKRGEFDKDIWALGMVMLNLAYGGKIPNEYSNLGNAKNIYEVFQSIINFHAREDTLVKDVDEKYPNMKFGSTEEHEDFNNILDWIFNKKISERFESIDEILEQDFFIKHKNISKEVYQKCWEKHTNLS
ncbi:protein kinase [Candidatus Margulisiibacteriota bacterium]